MLTQAQQLLESAKQELPEDPLVAWEAFSKAAGLISGVPTTEDPGGQTIGSLSDGFLEVASGLVLLPPTESIPVGEISQLVTSTLGHLGAQKSLAAFQSFYSWVCGTQTSPVEMMATVESSGQLHKEWFRREVANSSGEILEEIFQAPYEPGAALAFNNQVEDWLTILGYTGDIEQDTWSLRWYAADTLLKHGKIPESKQVLASMDPPDGTLLGRYYEAQGEFKNAAAWFEWGNSLEDAVRNWKKDGDWAKLIEHDKSLSPEDKGSLDWLSGLQSHIGKLPGELTGQILHDTQGKLSSFIPEEELQPLLAIVRALDGPSGPVGAQADTPDDPALFEQVKDAESRILEKLEQYISEFASVSSRVKSISEHTDKVSGRLDKLETRMQKGDGNRERYEERTTKQLDGLTSELGQHLDSISSLKESLSEAHELSKSHGERLEGLSGQLKDVAKGNKETPVHLDLLGDGLSELSQKIEGIGQETTTQLQGIETRIGTLDGRLAKMEEALETQSSGWGKVQKSIDGTIEGFEERLGQFEGKLEALTGGMGKILEWFGKFQRQGGVQIEETPPGGIIPEEGQAPTIATFECEALETLVQKTLGKEEEPILVSELVKIKALNIYDFQGESLDSKPVTSLGGLENAKNLEHLLLGYCQVSDLTPLTRLDNLTNLDLKSNGIDDLAPLSGLYLLESLDLETNQIQNLDPLAGLKQLETLKLGKNQIEDISALSSLGSLRVLNLHTNAIKDLSPIGGLDKLQELDLCGNPIHQVDALKNLVGLHKLHLLGNLIGDLRPVGELTNLEELSTGDEKLDDLTPLEKLDKLKSLSVSCTGGSLAFLRGLPLLEHLSLCVLVINNLEPVKDLENLTCLRIRAKNIHDLTSLHSMGNLKQLEIFGKPMDASDVLALEHALPGCEVDYY